MFPIPSVRAVPTLLVLLCLSLTILPVAAQDSLIIETFEFEGSVHDARYPDIPEGVQAFQIAQEALERSFEVFETLWGYETDMVPFSYFVDVTILPYTGDSEAEVQATAIIIPESELPADVLSANRHTRAAQVCLITVYLPGLLPVADGALFTLAHEISHCYQQMYDPGLTRLSEEVRGWWVEGSAEWMASLAYPELALNSLDREGFAYTSQAPLFSRDYENAFYWIFLAGHLGSPEAAIDVIQSLAGLNTLDEYSDILAALSPRRDGYMHEFGLGLIQDDIAYAPQASTLLNQQDEPLSVDMLPNVTYFPALGDYTFDLSNLFIEGFDGEGVVISPSSFTRSGSRISVRNFAESANFIELLDGETLKYCPETSTVALEIVVSRGAQGSAGAAANRVLNLERTDDCDEEQPEAACVVGSWDVQSLPEISVPGAPTPTYTWDVFRVTFYADSSMTANIENLATTIITPGLIPNIDNTNDPSPASVVTISMSGLTGLLKFTPEGSSTTRYAVEVLEWSPGMYMGQAQMSGMTMDITDMLSGFLETSVGGVRPPAYVECIGDQQLNYWVLSEYIDGAYVLTRADGDRSGNTNE